jgi:predicted amidohydrolase
MEIRVAGAQIDVMDGEVNSNFKAITRAIDYASSEKADILLTPEGALGGFLATYKHEDVKRALDELVLYAAGKKVGLALGTSLREEDGLFYNQLRFYDSDGKFLGFHGKILNCGTLTNPPIGEIEHNAVKTLGVFKLKGIIIGGLVCNDMWGNPMCTPMPDVHLSQQLSHMGAKIIFHAVNGSRDSGEFSQVVIRNFHESNHRMRAVAGKVWIVAVDSSYPSDMPNACYGGVISPDGSWTVRLPLQGKQYFVYTIHID